MTIATGKAKRNEFIEMLTALGDKYKKQKWGWIWSAAMRQGWRFLEVPGS